MGLKNAAFFHRTFTQYKLTIITILSKRIVIIKIFLKMNNLQTIMLDKYKNPIKLCTLLLRLPV